MPKKIVKTIAKKTFKAAYKTSKSAVKNTTNAVKSGVNSNYRQSSGTTDTGAKSVDLVKKTGKTTVKTVKNTVKTTKKTVRTVKNLPKNVKRTVKTTIKIAKATVKVVKATVKVIAKIIAWLSDPLVLAIVLGVIVVGYLVYSLVLVLQGGVAAEGHTKQAYSQAAGLGNVPTEFQDGLKILQECKKKMKEDGYDKWIDGFKYDPNNLKEADMIYMIRYDKDGNQKVFDTGIVSDPQKQALKDALEWNCGIDDVEILAIAYVLEQKDKNEITPEKEYKINQVKYTDTLINRILSHVVEWNSDHVDHNMKCRDENCSKKIEYIKRAEWINVEENIINYENAFNDWYNDIYNLGSLYGGLNSIPDNEPGRSNYINQWKDVVENRIKKWNEKYADIDKDEHRNFTADTNMGSYNSSNEKGYQFYQHVYKDGYEYYFEKKKNIKEYDEKETPCCEYKHDLYSNRLQFYNKESIMNALNFNDVDKLWEDLTENYLRTVQTPAVTS